MEKKESVAAYRDDCLAFRRGACGDSPCFECSPVHQALRIASVSLARWPRPLPEPRQ
jgi:hypothetical protein